MAISYLFKRVDGLAGWWISSLSVCFFTLTIVTLFLFVFAWFSSYSLNFKGLSIHHSSSFCYFSDDGTASQDYRYTISRTMIHSKFVSNISKYNHSIALPTNSSVSAAPNQIIAYSLITFQLIYTIAQEQLSITSNITRSTALPTNQLLPSRILSNDISRAEQSEQPRP
jgi:hypothetical protein